MKTFSGQTIHGPRVPLPPYKNPRACLDPKDYFISLKKSYNLEVLNKIYAQSYLQNFYAISQNKSNEVY